MTILRCDMCHKPLKAKRYQIATLLRPDQTLTVGPDCFRAEKKARQVMLQIHTADEIADLRAKVARSQPRI